MSKITLCILLQNNNHCWERHDCYIGLNKIHARATVPNLFYLWAPDCAAFNEKKTPMA